MSKKKTLCRAFWVLVTGLQKGKREVPGKVRRSEACTASWPLDFSRAVIRPAGIACVFHTLARHLDASLCLFGTAMSPWIPVLLTIPPIRYGTIRYDTHCEKSSEYLR